jgi:hypothetical protein
VGVEACWVNWHPVGVPLLPCTSVWTLLPNLTLAYPAHDCPMCTKLTLTHTPSGPWQCTPIPGRPMSLYSCTHVGTFTFQRSLDTQNSTQAASSWICLFRKSLDVFLTTSHSAHALNAAPL